MECTRLNTDDDTTTCLHNKVKAEMAVDENCYHFTDGIQNVRAPCYPNSDVAVTQDDSWT